MPGKIKVKVLAGRNLPVMDRASDTTDAFVEIKFGGVTHKTDVCRKSLNPHWSSTEWYRFEVDESELQDEPLQLRLMDHDTYSANDAIGKVVISLAPLLAREANNAKGTTGPPGGAVLSGWIPVFDTMHGIRGELNVIVKVELFSDFNKYKTSSCGVQFFHCPMIPPGYKATSIHGFVEELVVNDDPEYQWIDKIRTPRASNEARQVAFIKLSNQVQRLVGLKAAELGANAVVGYQQEFDLEGEAGVVARAIGTAVSISPMPTPSQPATVISCSQQQLKKCLDILATDDETVTDLNQYYKTHQDELQKMISILNPKGLSMLDEQENADDDDEKVELVRQSSLNSYAGSVSLYQDDYISQKSMRHLSEDQTALNRLLNRRDAADSDSSDGPIQKIKKLKTNFFTKRFTKRRDKDKQDDSVSIKSNSSDTSRISLIDIKNEFKKFKRLKKPKFKAYVNKEDEGEGMASILARSVIHARTSLACIAETQDSENSPCSTMRRTSGSEPIVSDDDKAKVSTEVIEEQKKVPEIHFSSLKNIGSEDITREPRERRLSESCPSSPMAGRTDNLLKLPGDKSYFGSVSSALSGESSLYSSSEDEEESSDLKTDTDEAIETMSSIVKTVMEHEADPAFIAQMDRKLTILQNTPPKISESILDEFDKREAPPNTDSVLSKVEINTEENLKAVEKASNDFECKVNEAEEIVVSRPSTSTKDAETCVPKPNTHFIKIHNPFANKKASASISCPSSPTEKHNIVYRSSKRIKNQLSKISKSISHISLFPKKNQNTKTFSQPGSSSDVDSKCPSKCPSETVLGSHFLSYSDLLELDKDRFQSNKLCKSDEISRSKFSMYIGSEPVSRCSLSGPSHPQSRDEHDNHKKEKHSLKPTGLIQTAMETMLIDKVESLLIPTSPEPSSNSKFFDDVSERLEEHKNAGLAIMRQVQSTTSSTTPRIVGVTPKRLSEDLTEKVDKHTEKQHHEEESKGLIHTAMETILMDKAHAILPDTESIQTTTSHEDFDNTEKHKKKDSKGSISTLLDKVHFHPHLFHHKKDDSKSHDIKSGGLIHTAMQTILIDRAQSMIPETPVPIPIRTEPNFGELGKHKKHEHIIEQSHKEIESTGLVHSALQTMLIDNVQAVLPAIDEPIPIRTDLGEDSRKDHNHAKEKESTGLVHSALQTMLIDNVQAVLPDTSEPIPIRTDLNFGEESYKHHDQTRDKESTGLIHSALQTMLIDNVQAHLPESNEPIPIRTDSDFGEELHKNHRETKNKESTGLVHSALQTMLIDNVQAVLPDTNEPIPIRTDSDFGEESHKNHRETKNKESTGLVHSALQTMLIDNVQAVLPDTNEPIPIRTDPDFGEESHKYHGQTKDKESTGLVHSALQAMLIDNVQAALSDFNEPIPIRTEANFGEESNKHTKDKDITGLLHTASHEQLINNDNKTHDELKLTGLVHTAMETMLLDKAQALINTDAMHEEDFVETKQYVNVIEHDNHSQAGETKGLTNTAMETILIDRMQTMFPKVSEENLQETHHKTDIKSVSPQSDTKSDLKSPGLVGTAMKTILMDKVESVLVSTTTNKIKIDKSSDTKLEQLKDSAKPKKGSKRSKEKSPKAKKIDHKDNIEDRKTLIRQDSIRSVASKTSNEDLSNTHITKPVLAAFPILSGPLDTIPSVPECSERSIDGSLQRSDTDSVDRSETNTSVCDNSHAACRFDRAERDRERDRERERDKESSPRHARHESYGGKEPGGSVQNSSLNASSTPMGIHRRSSDSDLSVTPKGGSLNTSAGNNVGSGGGAILRPSMNSNNLDLLEYPFLTMTEYPPGFIVHIGGAVCARSVKLVDGGGESWVRAAWWAELRTELRAHARALRCNAVIAYRDTAAICEDVCVLSASGTAAVINLDCDFNADLEPAALAPTVGSTATPEEGDWDACSVAHVPYSPGAGPYRAELSTCGGCRRARVPAVLLAACAKPSRLTAYPKAVNLTAVAARIRRAPPTAEPGARDISDQLPFLEYELHKLLLAKLRMQGANALFSLQTQIAIGERCVMALASGIAVKLHALPPPTPPRIKASEKEKDAIEMQKALWDTFTANKAANGYDAVVPETVRSGAAAEHEVAPVLDLCADKDACVLELDEAEDVETARALSKRRHHLQAFSNSLKPAASAQPLAFTQVSRARLVLSSGVNASTAAERQVARALDGAAYKLRRLCPAALNAAFQLELPEDEIQLVVSGTAIPLADPNKPELENGHSQSHSQSSHSQNSQDDDIFELDEEQMMKPTLQEKDLKEIEDKSLNNGQVASSVSLTTLSQVGVGRRLRRLCALRLLFVRETTAVRELGGLSGFLHTFTCEVLAILRAYTAALGGNALTSFYITQLMLQDNAHKNQGQCLLSVGGDVVHVSY